MKVSAKLLIGLGNPGSSYESTRHNMGRLAVQSYAHGFSSSFKSKASIQGNYAKTLLENDQTLHLVLPNTYMNLSGVCVRSCIKKFGIALENILVVSDDVEIPFGSMRIRFNGSHGGHNGLRSIESVLGTRDYCRLRLGIGRPAFTCLEEYVLQNFNEGQLRVLEDVMKNAHVVLDYWLNDKQELAKQFANQTKSLDQGEDHEENT